MCCVFLQITAAQNFNFTVYDTNVTAIPGAGLDVMIKIMFMTLLCLLKILEKKKVIA